MHVWRVETVDGKGPYQYVIDTGQLGVGHSRHFNSPDQDGEGLGDDLCAWLWEAFRRWDYKPERDPPSATLYCAMLEREAVREAFSVRNDDHAKHFTVTCYEVAPLYVLVLNSQVLFDKRFATILSREMFV